MPRHILEYAKGARNTVHRYNHQALYSLTVINSIVNSSPVLHVSFTPAPDDPFPVILPLIGQMGSFDRPSASISEPLECYLHGYISSRIMNLSRKSVEAGGKGLPVCIAATKVDGLVLTLTPNTHNYNYRSAILFGYASLVNSVEEKMWAMQLITNSVVTGRWDETRVPPNAAEMQSTQILKVNIDSGSAKVREGVPNDDKIDLNNRDILERVWTGVIPVYEYLGDPIPGPYNEVLEIPDHILNYKKHLNEVNSKYATDAAMRDAPVKKNVAEE